MMANYQSTYTGTQIDEAIGKAGTAMQGSTGSTDNALLRADGTGGATVQGSAATIDDNGNLTLTGATETVDNPIISATQTWNASGTTFTGIKFNVTDTESASGSLLMDLQVGGASKFKVDKAGNILSAGNISAGEVGFEQHFLLMGA